MAGEPWGEDFQWIPPKYDETRDRVTDDRDSQAPALLAGLMTDMDTLCGEFRRHSKTPDHELLSAIGTDIVVKWQAIREAMRA